MNPSFGSKELVHCLTNLGFSPSSLNASSHVKYKIPKGHKIDIGKRPFIIVILGKKHYDPHTSSSYIRQIMNLGFDKATILTCFSK